MEVQKDKKMKTNLYKQLSVCSAVIALGLALVEIKPVKAAEIVVRAEANIFGAGHTTAPAPVGGGGGQLPVILNFSAGQGNVFTFSGVEGTIGYGHNISTNGNPDGGSYPGGTDIASFNGISGIRNDNAFGFLVGVFLNDNEPADPAPASLNFTGNTSFAELSPVLNQQFFIGDGLTGIGSGDLQRFIAPNTATRLALGFADGWAIKGLPAAYSDNFGSVKLNYNLQTPAQSVPEPSSMLGLMALTGLGIGFKRKQRTV